MSLLPCSFLLILLSHYYIYAAFSGDYPLESGYRTSSDDSFNQFRSDKVESEFVIKVPVYEADFDTPLTIESLSRLDANEYFQIVESRSSKSSIVSELLQIKRTSSMKSLGEVVSDDSTINWFASRPTGLSKTSSFFVPAPIAEAPTESNSTSGCSSAQTISMSFTLRSALETTVILSAILEHLDARDLLAFSSTNSTVQKICNNHGKTVFKKEFPSLDGLSDSIVALRELGRILRAPEMKFDDWLTFNFPNVHPSINLGSFVNHRLENSKTPNELFALVNLIEFIRPSGWHDYFLTLPSPLSVFFGDKNVTMSEIKEKVLSIVMKASHYGHLRVLIALKDELLVVFPTIGPLLILELFLFGKEERQGVTWIPLQRSVHCKNTKTTNFLFYTLTRDKQVISCFRNVLKTTATAEEIEQMPSFLEKTFFPCLADQKICKILRRRLLNFDARDGIRPIHFAVSKSTSPQVLNWFFNAEMEFNGDISAEDFSVYLQLAFAAKSLLALRTLRKLNPKSHRIPVELAIRSDWLVGLQEYSELPHFKGYLLRYNNLFHLIASKNATKILEFFCSIFTRGEIAALTEQVDGNLKKPAEVALETENWDVLDLFHRLCGVKYDRKFLIRILEKNARILDNFLPDQQEKETFAHHFINYTNPVTLLEWSVLSGNFQAFAWFLESLPLENWKRFDGAGNTPIHLAVIVGNFEALRALLQADPSLKSIQNFYGETPSHLAHRIRDKTRTCNKIFLIDQIIQLLNNKD